MNGDSFGSGSDGDSCDLDPTETARVPAPPMIARDPDPQGIDGTGSDGYS